MSRIEGDVGPALDVDEDRNEPWEDLGLLLNIGELLSAKCTRIAVERSDLFPVDLVGKLPVTSLRVKSSNFLVSALFGTAALLMGLRLRPFEVKGRLEECTYRPCSGGSIELKSRKEDPLWGALFGVFSLDMSK